jgi:hypothetical protein
MDILPAHTSSSDHEVIVAHSCVSDLSQYVPENEEYLSLPEGEHIETVSDFALDKKSVKGGKKKSPNGVIMA